MRALILNGRRAALLMVGLTGLTGCVNVSSMDCARIAEEAKTISAAQPIQIRAISNSNETSRTENEARCTAQAELSDGRNTILYLRAYEEGGNTMVAYQETQFP